MRATNSCVQESFLGVPAAGVRQVFTATFTFRISDGLVHEIWRNADDLGRLIQLGAPLDSSTRRTDQALIGHPRIRPRRPAPPPTKGVPP